MAMPYDFLYRVREPLFAGYAPEKDVFEHGVAQVVLRLPALVPSGFSVTMTETRLPACCFAATAHDGSGHALRLGTGTGPEIGRLLHQVCVELAAGNVSLDKPAGVGSVVELKKFASDGDGQAVRICLAANRIARLDVPASRDGDTSVPALELFFISLELALQVAREIAQGLLSIQPA